MPRTFRWWLGPAAVLTLGLLIRLPFLTQLGPTRDVVTFVRWSSVIDQHGLTNVYDASEMDHGPLLAYVLAVAALLRSAFGLGPHGWVALVRLPAVLADVATAALLALVALRRTRSELLALVVCAGYLFNPAVWYGSAYWGQVDSLLALLLVVSVLALDRGAVAVAWGAYAGALALKLTGIWLAPLLIAWTVARHGVRSAFAGAAAFAAVAVVILAPWLLTGHAGSVLHHAYLDVPTEAPKVDVSAYNGWYLVLAGRVHDLSSHEHPLGLPFDYQIVGAVAFATAVILIVALALRASRSPVLPAAALALALFLLLTQQHERYAFAVLPLLLLGAIGVDGLSPELSRLYAVVSFTLLFNLITIGSFVPSLIPNVAASSEGDRVAFLKGAALAAAAVAVVVFGRVLFLIGRGICGAVADQGDG